jgi:UDP-N-acetylmuramoylalanine--D-glutamate ligase
MYATNWNPSLMAGSDRHFDTVIVGAGKTGLSCARYLAPLGGRLAVVDSRDAPPELQTLRRELPQIPVFTGRFDVQLLARARLIVVSPGVSLVEPAIRAAADAGAEVIGDIELFCREAHAPMVAVTGANGKSTVATLVARMIDASGRRAALGGNIGIPALALLGDATPDFYVLELSSFQLETVRSLDAAAAAVLNITPDHMDRYRSLEEYAAAKARIYSGKGAMILNLDDPRVAALRQPGRRTCGFTLSEPGADEFGLRHAGAEDWLVHGRQPLLRTTELRLRGRHNIANALAALALGSAIGLPPEPMLSALRSFTGLPHRCQWVAACEGVDWYDDSKGTNVGAACAAIAGLAEGRKLVLIAGGDGKGADFVPLADVATGRVRAAVLIGRDASLLGAVLAPVVDTCFATDLPSAVAAAGRLAQPGDAVLLSPACSSLDMFRSFEERGAVFSEAARRFCAQRRLA